MPTQQTVPWWITALVTPLLFLGLSSYLVASTTRLEKAVEAQSKMLTVIATLETRVTHLEKTEDATTALLAKVAAEQASRSPRLALLEDGMARLLRGLDYVEEQLTAFNLRSPHPAQPPKKR